MGVISGKARAFAGLIALVAWAGLIVEFWASRAMTGSVAGAIADMSRYFTVITNLILAMVLTGVALNRPRFAAPSLLGGVNLAILLVGIVHNLLLRDLVEPGAGAKVATVLLHDATPILTPLFWLANAPKGGLRPRDPLVWALFPLVYFAYALARGAAEGLYAYPFMDVAQIGWPRTGVNAVVIAAGFILVGYAVLWLDGRLARGAKAVPARP